MFTHYVPPTASAEASESLELSADERDLITAMRTNDYRTISRLAGEQAAKAADVRKGMTEAAQKASMRAIMDAQKSGDPAAIAAAFAAMHEAYADDFAAARERDAKEDAIHMAWIHAESDYSIPQVERVAMFVISRLVLQGYFTRYIFFDGFDNMVKNYARYITEAILDLTETPEPFFAELKNYGKK